MKTHDDDVNERLGSALRQKFENSHDQPNPALKGIILNSIRTKNSSIFHVLLSLIVFSVFLLTEQIGNEELTASKTASGIAMNKADKLQQEGLPLKKYLKIKAKPHNKNKKKNGKTASAVTARNAISAEFKTGQEIGRTLRDVQLRSGPNNRDSSKIEIKQTLLKSSFFITTQFSVQQKEFESGLAEKPFNNLEIKLNPTIDSLSFVAQQKTDINVPTEFLEKRSFISEKFEHDLEIENVFKNVVKKAVSKDQSKTWSLLIGFIPMNTFQVVSVSPQQSMNYQNFKFPSNFTSKKLAYKFQAGIERRNFQLLVNYARVPQSYSYEVATGDYQLDSKNKQYTISRDGVRKEQKATMYLIGAGLRKNIPVRHGPFRTYFMNLGLDFSRDLGSKKNLSWGTAGVGKEMLLNSHSSILIGPYMEYSFSKLANPANGIQLKPYQVGVSVSLKYWKMKTP